MQSLLLTLLASIPIVLTLLALYKRSIYHLLRSEQDAVVIDRSTNDLATSDIALVILLLVVENVRNLLGLTTPRSSKKHSSRGVKADSDASATILPDVSVVMNIDLLPSTIKQYHIALRLSDHSSHPDSAPLASAISDNNAHLALFLSAVSGPAILLLLARPKCPVNPLGGVNVRNYIRIIRPDLCRRVIGQVTNQVAPHGDQNGHKHLTVRASPLPETRRVNRGTEVDIRAVLILHEDGQSSEGTEIFEQIFTVLEFGKAKSSDRTKTDAARRKAIPSSSKGTSTLVDVSKKDLKSAPRLASYFKIQLGDPILWARLCKDYNLIHISALAARLFGFRSKIAHGNHAVAKAVEMLARSGQEDFLRFCNQQGEQELWLQVEFKRPILLPAEIGVRRAEDSVSKSKSEITYAAFEVFKAEKVHIEASVGALKM